MDTRLMANCDNECEIDFMGDVATNVAKVSDQIAGEAVRQQTAQDILDAVYNPKVNFIEYIEGIIGE